MIDDWSSKIINRCSPCFGQTILTLQVSNKSHNLSLSQGWNGKSIMSI